MERTAEMTLDLEAAPPNSGAPAGPFGRLVDALNAAGSVTIAAVMLLMCADVLARNLANKPIDGVAEMVATSIIMIVFLQLPATIRHGRMSRADLFIDPFTEKRPIAGRRLHALYSAFGIFACLVIMRATWPMLVNAWEEGEFFGIDGVFTFPVWPMRAIVLAGTLLGAVQYALLAWQHLREADKGGAQ